MHLLRALLYLRLMSLRNAVRRRLQRLRQPKYFFGAMAGALYFWFFFFRRTGRAGPGQAMSVLLGDPARAESIAAVLLMAFVFFIWILPGDQPGLALNEAEVAFLFPAPLARRQLIHYKLLDGLVLSLFGALFFTLLSSGLRHGWVSALRHLGAWWSLNANLSLHQSAAALTIARLSSLGLRTTRRRIVLLTGAIGLAAALAFVAVERGPAVLAPLLWPARLAVRPFLNLDAAAYALALLPACGLVLVHYFWVHQLEAPFEEASIVRAQKSAETVARLRAGQGVRLGRAPTRARRAPFPLVERLPPEFALLWKNLMVAPPYLNRKVFLGAAVVVAAGMGWLQRNPEIGGPRIGTTLALIALVLLGYVLAFGPQLARNDLRGDLLHADLLKAWPLPGWRVVLGGLLAPTVLLTGITWLLLLVVGTGLRPPPSAAGWLTPELRVSATAALALVMPALCAVQLLVPNAATLVFPAWAQSPRAAGGGGVDVMGQRLIFFAGQLICLAFALLPAVVAAALTIFLTGWLVGPPVAVLLAVVPVLGIFAGELWLGVHWIGLRFEALDISAELRP